MSIYPLHVTDVRASHRASEAREFRLMFFLAFLLFLTAGAMKRLVTPLHGAGRKSLFAEARAAANTCLPFAFMN
jgi:hypothetical protein